MRSSGVGMVLGALVLLLLMAIPPGGASAADPDQIALVVQYGDGQVDTLCIAVEEEQVSGVDLLLLSGLDLVVDTATMGVTICQIGAVGCAYPAEACFCQCMGGEDCAYWNYFYRDPGEADWTYSVFGAAIRKAAPGSVEAWIWGDGSTPPDEDLTFEAICMPPEPTATQPPPTPTSPPATEPPVTVQPATTDAPTVALSEASAHTPTLLPSATRPLPSSTPTPADAASQGLVGYWPFGLALVGLVIAAAFVWLRRV